MKQHKILKGKRADAVYLAPEVTAENINNIIKWYGLPNLINTLATDLKHKFQQIYFNAVDKTTGVFNLAKFELDAAQFTSSGMKMKEINDKLDELQASLNKLLFGAQCFPNPAEPADSAYNVNAARLQKEVMELNSQIRAYMAMKEERSRKSKEDEEETEDAAIPV